MLATFVIGLREGLEAALIVGIIAAFLRKNGKSLTPMWVGVALAVVLSILVGVGLDLFEQALPQAAQEGMETVIGAVAIFFVTGMIAWMNAHARDMKSQLEREAAEALGQTGAYALASMAFLAVLKEGFETSVFLLATFSAAQSAALAATGAVIGLATAVIIGWGIYIGGVRINLSRFFRVTGAFLILVAAGLVIASLRTAHEAGWLNAGQQPTVNLAWLVAPGSVQSALITGVLGIPADPRLIEVLGWFAYLVPVALFIYWPQARRPQRYGTAWLRLCIGTVLVAVAAGLAVLYPVPRPQVPAEAPLVATEDASSSPIGTARLSRGQSEAALEVSLNGANPTVLNLPASGGRPEQHDGIDASTWTVSANGKPTDAPSTLTLDQVVALHGGRVPVGLNPGQHSGPFAVNWSVHRSIHVWSADDVLLDAIGRSTTIVTLSGSGLQTPRTFAVGDGGPNAAASDWRVSDIYRDKAAAAVNRAASARTERYFWAVQLPVMFALVGLFLAILAARTLLRLSRAPQAFPLPRSHAGKKAADPSAKGAKHAVH